MAFYSDINKYYDKIFPFNGNTFNFLKSYIDEESSVLDLGCGTGLYLNRLSEYVSHSVGIDLDEEMIKTANKKSVLSDFILMNITEIEKLNGVYDLIYSIGNVISYLDIDALDSTIKKIKNRLSPNGKWIFQTVNWDKLKNVQYFSFPSKIIEQNSFTFFRSYERIDAEKVNFNVKLINENNVIFENTDMLFSIISNEIIEKHEASGFVLQEHLGNCDRSLFNPKESLASIYVFTQK